MRVLKRVTMTVLFVMAMGMTSCTKADTTAEDELYENAIEKGDIKEQDKD